MHALKLAWAAVILAWSCAATSLNGCNMVHCDNGTVTLTMDKNILAESSDCEHRLYNENNMYVADAKRSGKTQHSCLPKIYWKLLCDNKTMDRVVCFTVSARSTSVAFNWFVVIGLLFIIAIFL